MVGATYPAELARIRELCPEMIFLVPGVGAQGGDILSEAGFSAAEIEELRRCGSLA